MRIDRPSSRPEDPSDDDQPKPPRQPDSDGPTSDHGLRDSNGLTPAEYVRAWNKKVESGEAEKEQAAEERPRLDVSLRDDNGMTAAELRFQRNKRIDEAEAKAAEADEAGFGLPPRRSVVTDAQGRTGAEIRFQQAQRAEEAAKARAAEAAAEKAPEGDARPEIKLRTVTEELGESKSWHSFSAAKREIRARLGHEPGIEVDHLVEQCQIERSGFPVEQINSSDNMTRLDKVVHQEKTARYARHVPGTKERLRDSLDGEPWDYQLRIGRRAVEEELRKQHGND